jgi:hypothetical protein
MAVSMPACVALQHSTCMATKKTSRAEGNPLQALEVKFLEVLPM